MPGMLRERLLLGPVLILALLGVLWLDEWLYTVATPGWAARLIGTETFPPGTIIVLIATPIAVLAAIELAGLLARVGLASSRWLSAFGAALGIGVSCLIPEEVDAVRSVAIVSSAAIVMLLASVVYFSRHQSVEGVVAATGGVLLAFVYLGLTFGFLLAIRREHSAWLILWILLTTKGCDIGAYFTGRAIGRHKLIVWLSPGKTWEGLVGGVLASALLGAVGAWALGAWLGTPIGIGAGAVMGAVFGLVGQLGDLVASMVKRDAGAKDSSRTLPGFGGVIDVVDSPLLVAPVAYWMLTLVS
ncbi:MAG: hypothetical protein EA378_12230 [Phycisphaerales bacterium]|nr:MAG: hypothetical protein EA378_12230 [Phycisphaerales bacterium]